MAEIIENLHTIEWGTFLGWLAIIIVVSPKIVEFINKFEKDMNFQFPWTNYKIRVNKKFEELDMKINTTRKELDDKIDTIHKAEHVEHEAWHQQSITIRDNLAENQHNLAENQHKLEENQVSFMNTLSEISRSLAELKADFLDERLERKRWNILNCASKLRNGDTVDMEEFINVFQDYDSYEDIIKKNGLTNGLIEESIKFIREKYQELLCHEK